MDWSGLMGRWGNDTWVAMRWAAMESRDTWKKMYGGERGEERRDAGVSVSRVLDCSFLKALEGVGKRGARRREEGRKGGREETLPQKE